MNYSDIFKNASEQFTPIRDSLCSQSFTDGAVQELSKAPIALKIPTKTSDVIPYQGSGIYIFWADLSALRLEVGSPQEALSWFLEKWDEGKDGLNYFPRSNKSRAKKLIREKDSFLIPFYLGKSKNISKRVQEHIELQPNKKTYALKLNQRSDLLNSIPLRVGWLPLDTSNDNYFLVQEVESILRDRLNPIIGKQ